MRPFSTEPLLLLLPLVSAFSGAASTPDLPLPLSRACGLWAGLTPPGARRQSYGLTVRPSVPFQSLSCVRGLASLVPPKERSGTRVSHCGDQGTPLFVSTC